MLYKRQKLISKGIFLEYVHVPRKKIEDLDAIQKIPQINLLSVENNEILEPPPTNIKPKEHSPIYMDLGFLERKLKNLNIPISTFLKVSQEDEGYLKGWAKANKKTFKIINDNPIILLFNGLICIPPSLSKTVFDKVHLDSGHTTAAISISKIIAEKGFHMSQKNAKKWTNACNICASTKVQTNRVVKHILNKIKQNK